ncbi:MAG: DUF72 domain-containing protein [Calditrichia bacterium]
MKMMIGTSGYSYEDWRGNFYPPKLPKGKMLDYYAEKFSVVEINSTYYRIPHPAVFYHLDQKTPDNFEFIVKTNQETTHIRKKNKEAMNQLIDAIQPIEEKGKFSGFLAQFPYSFKNTPENRDYIVETKMLASPYPLFVEFRNWTWDQPQVFEMLKRHSIFYVNVDQPELRGLLKRQEIVTGGLGYVRFHGRNSSNWWKGTNQTRYDYLYSASELEEWLIRLSHILQKTNKSYIFFNNHPQGNAIRNAEMLKDLVDSQPNFLNE